MCILYSLCTKKKARATAHQYDDENIKTDNNETFVKRRQVG